MSPWTVSPSSPSRLVHGLEARTSTRTGYPALMSARTIADPTKPVAPVTSTRPAVTVSPVCGRIRRRCRCLHPVDHQGPVSNPHSGCRVEQMHAPEVGPQSYAVTGVPRGFGRQPGDHL